MTAENQDKAAERFAADMEEMERRLAEQYPGVQAVMETYALAQAGLQQFDAFAHALNPRPNVISSNGSA